VKKLSDYLWTGVGIVLVAALVLTGMGWVVGAVVGLLVAGTGKIVLDPLVEYKKTISQTVQVLGFYYPTYKSNQARESLRQKATELNARAQDVWFYRVFSSVGVIPNIESIEEVCKNLRAISNEPNDSPDSPAVVKGKVNEIYSALKRRMF
jgi:hypothetical protein